MIRKFVSLLTLVLALSWSLAAQDAKSVLQSATKAMGDVKSVQFSGTGHVGSVGQAYSPSSPWPINNITAYTRTVDYGSKSSKEELTQVEPNPIRKGGAAPFAGEQKQVNLVSGQYAWNQPGAAPQPAVAAAEERQLQIWLTPHGFLKSALAAKDATAISMTLNGASDFGLSAFGRKVSRGTGVLATIGATAPFVGLFGTVWGILQALIAIGVAGQASIDKVAGPVGQALIATALGLAVAVPAVLCYNYLVRRNKVINEKLRGFATDLQTYLITNKK